MNNKKCPEGRTQQNQRWLSALTLIKLAHTAIWAFFAGCILAIPLAACIGRFDWALVLTAAVLVECIILVLNRWRCPLTDVAAQYTGERADNFDIYLPRSLARHNKTIFGLLFVVGELIVLVCWVKG
jgi:hypothetical protein